MSVTTVDTSNYDEMAKAMGITADAGNKSKQTSNLARLRISHSAIMGETELKGKKVNMEVVSGGHFKLEVPDSSTVYAPQIKIRTFLQRFMYKRFIKGSGNVPNRFVKTVMGESLYVDLKDNDGGFNCGKPSGWIKDFKALPTTQQDLIRQIKRTRVVFGLTITGQLLLVTVQGKLNTRAGFSTQCYGKTFTNASSSKYKIPSELSIRLHFVIDFHLLIKRIQCHSNKIFERKMRFESWQMSFVQGQRSHPWADCSSISRP